MYREFGSLEKIAKYSSHKTGEEISDDEEDKQVDEPEIRQDEHEQGKDDEEEERIRKLMTGSMSKLPLEIIFDILARVPIKTLSQSCKYVSKSWFKIIRYHRFARIQHAKASTTFSPCVAYFNLRSKVFYLVDHQVFDDHATSTKVHCPEYPGFGWAFDVVGECNGLICMSPDHLCYKPQPYLVFNPITKDYINLPKSPKYKIAPRLSAFGSDSVTNQHKVVRIMPTHEVEIYTLGSGPDGWRKASNIPREYGYVAMDTSFVNGALHWTSFKRDQGKYAILALDMVTENFQEIPPPPCVALGKGAFPAKRVAVLGGCLCFADEDFDDHIDIWVMKSNGMQYFWSKDYVLKKKSFQCEIWNDGYQVIKLHSGELLLKHQRKDAVHQYEYDLLHYYDPKKRVFKRIATRGIPSDVASFGHVSCLIPIAFVGNLISPKNLGSSTTSYCKKGNSLEASSLLCNGVSMASNQLSKSEACAKLESFKYIYNYVFKGHDQTILVLDKVDQIQKVL